MSIALRPRVSPQGMIVVQRAAARSDATLPFAIVSVTAAALLYIVGSLLYGWPAFVQ